MRRARRDEDKQARQEQILAAAATLLDTRPTRKITMTKLATEAKLAKGTLYLYFRTREEVFVALAHAELSAWLDSLHDAEPGSIESISSHLADALLARPRLLALLPVLHSVLARNLSATAEERFGAAHRALLGCGGAHLERLLPDLPEGKGYDVFYQLYFTLVGLSQVRPDRLTPPAQPPNRQLHAAVRRAAHRLLVHAP